MWAKFPDGDNPEITQHINLKSIIGVKNPYKDDFGCLIRLNNGQLVPLAVPARDVLNLLKPWWMRIW